MGFFSSMWSACKETVEAAGSAIKAGYHKITGNEEKALQSWQNAKDSWNEAKTNFSAAGHALTGRDKFEEAEKLYSEITANCKCKLNTLVK